MKLIKKVLGKIKKLKLIKWLRKRRKLMIYGLVTVALLLPVALGMAYELAYMNKVYPRVWVAGEEISNLNELGVERVMAKLAAEITAANPAIQLGFGEQRWQIDKQVLGLQFLPQKVAQKAIWLGRQGDFKERVNYRFLAWRHGIRLSLEYELNEDLLKQEVATVAAKINIPVEQPRLEVLDRPNKDNKLVVAHQGKPGREVDTGRLLNLIHKQISEADGGVIEVPVREVAVTVTDEELVAARDRAEKLALKKLNLSTDEKNLTWDGQDLIDLSNLKAGLDESRVRERVATLSATIDRPSQNAAFQYVEGRVTEFKPAKDGLTVNQEQLVRELLTTLSQMENSDEEKFSLTIPLAKAKPAVGLNEVNNLGIKELLGKGTSTFRGSIPGRVHNIGLSSSRISGVLVPPGETFSFNQTVGEISANTGYQQAYVIRSGATVLDDGGGVCQTSTTLFRAALNAGLPIVERRAHSYRVGYYEQNAKPGLDATVYAPSVDLKIKNDTQAHILIQTIFSGGGKTLSVEIYGTSDGRKAEVKNHAVWDVIPAPPARYQDDPSLPSGTTKQVDFSANGAKVKFEYVVTRGGETIFSKIFFSTFQPWQAVFLRATAAN